MDGTTEWVWRASWKVALAAERKMPAFTWRKMENWTFMSERQTTVKDTKQFSRRFAGTRQE
jgi:hypothetical protein